MRLIDADALRQEIESKIYWGQVSKDNVESLGEIDDAPTVDAVPVVYGQWVRHYYDSGEQVGDEWYCSECNMCNDRRRTWYCPHCGAKMDGGNEE